jgi:hypothetical protein
VFVQPAPVLVQPQFHQPLVQPFVGPQFVQQPVIVVRPRPFFRRDFGRRGFDRRGFRRF